MEDATESWIADNLELAVSQGSLDPCEIFARPEGIRLLKAISEIAYFSIYGALETSPQFIARISAMIEPILSHTSFLSLMRFNPDYATLFLSLLDVGTHLGVVEVKNTANIEKICRWFSACGPERVPYRLLDRSYGFGNIGFPQAGAGIDQIVPLGCMASRDRILNIQQHDAYALTHTIFYLTDFGKMPAALDPDLLPALQHTLVRLSHLAVARDDMDLLAEYVLSMLYMHRLPAGFARFVDILKSARQQPGFWKGPGNIEVSLRKDGISEHLLAFYSHYHTTVLAHQASKDHTAAHRFNISRIAPVREVASVPAQPGPVPLLPPPRLSPAAEIERALENGDTSTDLLFVIWFANRLGVGFGDLCASLHALVETVDVCAIESIEIEKIRFVSGHRLDRYRDAQDDRDIETVDDFWTYAFILSHLARHEQARSLRRKLSLTYEQNRILYVRLLSLGIAWNVFDEDDISNDSRYVDSLYSADGHFLWSQAPDKNDVVGSTTALLGRLILERQTTLIDKTALSSSATG